MRIYCNLLFIALNLIFLPFATAAEAAPLFTFAARTKTTMNVPSGATRTIKYRLKNQSSLGHTLVLTSLPAGITQTTAGAGYCANPIVLKGGQACTLTLTVTGASLQSTHVAATPQVCQQAPDGTPSPYLCYKSSPEDTLDVTRVGAVTTTLTSSVPFLGLKVSGLPRQITITNNGPALAQNVTYQIIPALPAGTTISPSGCGNILANNTCVLTITPGANPSTSPGSSPNPSVIEIEGTNTNQLAVDAEVLTYGNIYQGGFIFNIDDSAPNTGSIGGTVAGLNDTVTAPGISWGGNAINVGDTTNQNTVDGANNGSANSDTIIRVLTVQQNIPKSTYAAGQCNLAATNGSGTTCTAGTTGCYDDWYLPAICQLGPNNWLYPNATDCSPTGTYNIQQQLFVPSIPNVNLSTSVYYYSSTQYSGDPATIPVGTSAWVQYYASGGGSGQGFSGSKDYLMNVRCVRGLTP